MKGEEERMASVASVTSATLATGVGDSILRRSHFNDLVTENLQGSLVAQVRPHFGGEEAEVEVETMQ